MRVIGSLYSRSSRSEFGAASWCSADSAAVRPEACLRVLRACKRGGGLSTPLDASPRALALRVGAARARRRRGARAYVARGRQVCAARALAWQKNYGSGTASANIHKAVPGGTTDITTAGRHRRRGGRVSIRLYQVGTTDNVAQARASFFPIARARARGRARECPPFTP